MNDVLWEGPIGNTKFTCKVVRNGESVFRGVLHIYEGENLRYQREVPIAHNSSFGSDSRVAQVWADIITDWVRNKS